MSVLAILPNILAFGWEPEIRGITTVLIGAIVLMGSVWLLLATNTGARLGMLLALTGFFGWMVLMGAYWWVYGIGLQGDFPSWQAQEIVVGDLDGAASDRVTVGLEGWESLALDDPERGQAQAAADAVLIDPDVGVFDSTAEFVPLDVFTTGGDTYFFTLRHNAHFALVQVQSALPQVVEEGRPPPRPVIDESQPVISVVMVRDMGDRRVPPAMITLGSLAIFLVLAYTLHRRDKESERNRSMALERAG